MKSILSDLGVSLSRTQAKKIIGGDTEEGIPGDVIAGPAYKCCSNTNLSNCSVCVVLGSSCTPGNTLKAC